MAFELTVVIGGLCLLLERNDEVASGLFVLMPKSHPPPHEPIFLYNPANNGGHGTGVEPIAGHDIDLTGHLSNGGIVGLPDEIPSVSRFADNAAVLSKCSEKPFPEDLLLCRVQFDLGHRVFQYGDLADMNVTLMNGVVERRNMTGLARLTFTVSSASITVAGFQLTPIHGAMEIGFYNAPNGNINHPGHDHPANEIQHHFASYYPLVGRVDGPLPRTARPHPKPSTLKMKSIDPVQCTLGGGCPTSDPC